METVEGTQCHPFFITAILFDKIWSGQLILLDAKSRTSIRIVCFKVFEFFFGSFISLLNDVADKWKTISAMNLEV